MAYLGIKDLSISFGGLKAVDGVSFEVGRREIFSIIGPNGAGKSTLFNCISGLCKPERGSILFEGKELVGLKPYRIASLGVARTFQNIELFGGMTAMENLLVGHHCRMRSGPLAEALNLPGARREERRVRERAEKIVDFLGIGHLMNQRAADLPFGYQKRLELARALALEPKLILLDEPAAGMNDMEMAEMGEIILRVRERHSVTLLLVEHDMRLVMGISDRIAVLNFGRKIAEGVPMEIRNDPAVVEAYLGEEDPLC